MTSLLEAIRQEQPGSPAGDPQFPHAPDGWTRNSAVQLARQSGLQLGEDHWELVRRLQAYYARHDEGSPQLRDLHDALDEYFHDRGGIKFLYRILPGGPVAQGCRLAGLQPPVGAFDKGFGSVA